MNRQQRRAIKRKSSKVKPPQRQHRNTGSAMSRALLKASNQGLSEKLQGKIATTLYMRLAGLKSGAFTSEDYIDLVLLNYVMAIVAKRMEGDDKTGQIATIEPKLLAAAEALTDIGERSRETGKLIGKGSELKAIGEAVGLHEKVIELAPAHYILDALEQAEKQANRSMSNASK